MCLGDLLDERPEIPLNPQIVEMVFREVFNTKSKFESRRFYLCDLFPDFITIVQNKQASQILLNTQKKVVHESYENGFITEDDYLKMSAKVDRDIANLDIKKFNWSSKEINELELIEPSFSKLNKDYLKLIRENYRKVEFSSGQPIYSKGDLVKGLYIIIRGMAEDNLTLDFKMTLGVGAIVSFANIVNPDNRCLTTLHCIKDCATYFVSKEIILEIIEKDLEFARYIYKSALYYYLKIFGSISYNQNLNDAMITTLVETSEFLFKKPGEAISIDGGGFLFKGVLKPMPDGPSASQHDDGDRDIEVDPEAGELHDKSSHSLSPSPNRKHTNNKSPGRSQIIAPMLVNPFMSGYYKVVEECVYFSFRNSGVVEEVEGGSVKFSFRNSKASLGMLRRGGSNKHKIHNQLDIDRVFNEVVDKDFSELADQLKGGKKPGKKEDKKKR